jgi:hypothetical protein
VPPLNSAVRRHGKLSATFRSERSPAFRLRVRLMTAIPGEVVTIDLASAISEEDLIRALGGALQFGGPNPSDNIPTSDAPSENRGFGLNWNAVTDCCRDLHRGGIWGTSRVFQFPLVLVFRNWAHLRSAPGDSLATLNKVLSNVADESRLDGRELRHEFQ